MNQEQGSTGVASSAPIPAVVDRAAWQAQLDGLLVPSGEQFRTNGRPTAQWSRLAAGRSDDLGNVR